MPTAAVVNVSLRARHEQFTSDMDKMSNAGKKWAGDMEASGGRVAQMFRSVGLTTGMASRSFGQLATGALLMSGAMDEVGQVGQSVSHVFGGFLIGGPIGAGVTAVAEAYSYLAGEEKKSAEELKKEAEARKALMVAEGGRMDALLGKIRERQMAEESAATGTPVDELRLKQQILDLEGETYGISKADTGQKLDRLAILRDELRLLEEKRASEQASADWAYIAKATADETKRIRADEAAAVKNLADAAKEQAEIEERNREQWRAGEEIVRRMEEDRKRNLDEYIASQERALSLRADEIPFAADLEQRERAVLAGLNDQVAAIDRIIARKRDQLALAQATADAEKSASAFAQAQAAVDRQAAADAKRQAADEDRAAKAAAGGGSDSGGGGSGYGGGFGGGASMGPLAAAREAKRIGRQQRRWKNHADNQAASRRESLSYGTIEDGGMDPFAFDLGSVMAKYKPGGGKAKAEPGAQTTTSIGSDASAAANEAVSQAAKANNIAQKAADAAKAAADSAKSAADTASKTATSAEDVASSSGSCADSLTTIDSGISAAATNLSNAAGKLVSIADRVKALEDAAATIQAAVGGQ